MPVPFRAWTAGEFVALLVKDTLPETAPLDCGVKVTVKEADVPAAMVAGSVIPESTNSLAMLSDDTVTATPVALRLPFSEDLEPTTTFPKLNVAGETASCPGAVPVPESATLSPELDAFETMDTVPLAAPALVGANVTVNVTLWFEESVAGKVNPLTEKAPPLTVAWEMVTADPPVFVNVSDLPLLLPTCTLPNGRLDGFAASVPGPTPVPDNAMLRLGFAPLEVMLMLPLAAPLVVGANCTVNDVLCPAFNVTGTVEPLRLNPLPLAVAAEMVRAVPPEFVSVSERDFALPTWTLPKPKLEGFGES